MSSVFYIFLKVFTFAEKQTPRIDFFVLFCYTHLVIKAKEYEMKTVFLTIYRMICHFSMAFSGILLFFWSFMGKTAYIDYERIGLFFDFALIFGISSIVFSLKKLPDIVKIAIHFVANTIGFIVTIMSVAASETQAFVVGVVFVLVYIAITSIAYFVKVYLKKLELKASEREKKEDVDKDKKKSKKSKEEKSEE